MYSSSPRIFLERTREVGSKRDSQGNVEGKGDSSRDRISFHSEENRRIAPYYQANYQKASVQVTKTTSANTFAVSTTTHRWEDTSFSPLHSTNYNCCKDCVKCAGYTVRCIRIFFCFLDQISCQQDQSQQVSGTDYILFFSLSSWHIKFFSIKQSWRVPYM